MIINDLLVQLWYHILIHHELELNTYLHFHWYSHHDIEDFEIHSVCHAKQTFANISQISYRNELL